MSCKMDIGSAPSVHISLIPYKQLPREKIKLLKRSKKGAYDHHTTLQGKNFIPEVY